MTNQPYAPTEDELQRYSADVLRAFAVPGVIYFHVPNGGWRDPATANKLKSMGVRSGVPDWLLLLPHGRYACVEIKTLKGRQSANQVEFQESVKKVSGVYRIARTPEEIDAVFTELGAIRKPQPENRRQVAGGADIVTSVRPTTKQSTEAAGVTASAGALAGVDITPAA
jgi:hypothetical protein